MVINKIRRIAQPGTTIPKPKPKGIFSVKGNGIRRDQDALIYTIPNHVNPNKPYKKGINASEFEKSYKQLKNTGKLTRSWFQKNLPKCEAEGPCNFTTVGGLFILLGKAKYEGSGIYQWV